MLSSYSSTSRWGGISINTESLILYNVLSTSPTVNDLGLSHTPILNFSEFYRNWYRNFLVIFCFHIFQVTLKLYFTLIVM